jgi:hypothetical protein
MTDANRNFKRYAIYHLPAEPLAGVGAAWLGWDVVLGQTCAHWNETGFDIAEVTRQPRRYGLHATIKAPFRLSQGQTFGTLAARTADLCQRLSPVSLPGLALTHIGRFLALVARGDQTALKTFAGQVVEELDRFRAPLTDVERARRLKARLSPAQMRYLDQWGYPHVMEQFNFHVTLTGPLAPALADQVEAALHHRLQPVLAQPYLLDSLSLVGEDPDGFHHEIERFPLISVA